MKKKPLPPSPISLFPPTRPPQTFLIPTSVLDFRAIRSTRYFEAPSVEDVQNITGALQSDAIERRRATGSIVYDKEVCRVQIVNPGGGYSPAYPVDVRIQTPAECGGIASRQGATANADLVKPDFRSSPKPSLYEQELLKFDRSFDSRISRMDEDILALIPSSQILSYDPKQTRINFQERSAIGFNVTTRFGPRGKVPIIKDDVIGWNEFSRIAAAGAVCASIGHGALVPLDTIKLKLQTAPAGKYSNIVDASVKILRDEGGIKTFINGFQPEVGLPSISKPPEMRDRILESQGTSSAP